MPGELTADNVAYLYGEITKIDDDKHLVGGTISSEAVDLAGQIVDPEFLKRAIPPWLASWANVREGHDPRKPVGVAKTADLNAPLGPYVMTEVIDSEAWKKIKAGLLKGYSVGIKDPRVVYDAKAPNGRIIDGIFLELSLVDRPCNPDARIDLYKAADSGSGWKDMQRNVVIEPEHAPQQTAGEPGAVARPTGTGSQVSNAETMAVKAAVLQAQADGGSEAARLVLAGGDFQINGITGQITGVVAPDAAKADYSTEERKQMAASGEALPDGSFPIKNATDLENAALRAHQGDDPAAARAHIRKRAKALGLPVPDSAQEGSSAQKVADREAPDLSKAAKHPIEHGAHNGVHNHLHDDGMGGLHTHDHVHYNDNMHEHPHCIQHGMDGRVCKPMHQPAGDSAVVGKAAGDFTEGLTAATPSAASSPISPETFMKEVSALMQRLSGDTDKDRDGDVDTAANMGPNGTGEGRGPAADFREAIGESGLIPTDTLPLALKSAGLDSPNVVAAIDRIIAARVSAAVTAALEKVAGKEQVNRTLGTTADVAKSAAAVARGLEALASQLEATTQGVADVAKAAELANQRLDVVEKTAAPVKGLGSQAVAVDKVIGLDATSGAAARVGDTPVGGTVMQFDQLVEKAATLDPASRNALAVELYKIIQASPAQNRS